MPAPYQTQPYRNDARTARLSDLLRRPSEIQASLQLQNADTAARTAAVIGNTVSNTMGDLLRYKADEPRRRMVEQQIADAKYAANKREQVDNDKQMRDATVARYTAKDEKTGKVSVNRDAIIGDLLQAGRQDLVDDLSKSWQGVDQDAARAFALSEQVAQLKKSGLAKLAYAAKRAGGDVGAFTLAIKEAESRGLVTPDEAKKFEEQANGILFSDGVTPVSRKQTIGKILDQFIAGDRSVLPDTKLQSFPAENDVYATADDGTTQLVRPGRVKPERPVNVSRGGTAIDPNTGEVVFRDNRGPLSGGDGTDKPLTRAQRASADRWKAQELRNAERDFTEAYYPHTTATGVRIEPTKEDQDNALRILNDRKKQIQAGYLDQIGESTGIVPFAGSARGTTVVAPDGAARDMSYQPGRDAVPARPQPQPSQAPSQTSPLAQPGSPASIAAAQQAGVQAVRGGQGPAKQATMAEVQRYALKKGLPVADVAKQMQAEGWQITR